MNKNLMCQINLFIAHYGFGSLNKVPISADEIIS